MTITSENLGWALLVVVGGGAILISSLLRLRHFLMEKDLKMSADEIWESVPEKIKNLGLKKQDMLYSVQRDMSRAVIALVIRDSNNSKLTEIPFRAGARARSFTLAEVSFMMEFPLTWKKTGTLRRTESEEVLARYQKRGWGAGHEFQVPGYGILKAERLKLTRKMAFYYTTENKISGVVQQLSALRSIGRVSVLPSELPLEVRIFILSL